MAKFFVEKQFIKDNEIVLQGENKDHIIRVLRLKEGDNIEVSNCSGYEYICIIKQILEDKIIATIIDFFGNESEPKVKITLYQALPKSEKMELIIQKCVELGIYEIVPVKTDRTIAKIDKKENKKIDRWNKISESASKQSKRGIIPKVSNLLTFEQAIQQAKQNDISFIPYEKETKNSIKNIIKKFTGNSIAIFIGPEGGFSDREIKIAIQNEVIPLTLGKRILRTETAGFITTAILLYELEG